MKGKTFSLLLAVVALLCVTAVSAQLQQDGKGPVNAYNYDEVQLANLSRACAYRFECQQGNPQDIFFYNCAYDAKSAQCQCSQGSFSKCNVTKSSLDAKQVVAMRKGGSFFSGVFGAVSGFARSALQMIIALPLWAKVAAGAIVLAVVIIFILRKRNTAGNNFRRAQLLHRVASELHEKGEEDRAKLLFEKANYYRELADGQQKV